MKKLKLFNLVLFFILIFLSGCKKQEFLISFISHDEKIFNDIIVGRESVELPVPEKEGYVFIGWFSDKGIRYSENVVFASDTILYAKWEIKLLSVTFLDYNDKIIEIKQIKYGDNIDITPMPVREGYEFIGWNHTLKSVTEDLIVKAKYQECRYHVVFVDWDEKVISEQFVLFGMPAINPEPPQRDGYIFMGWNQDINNIKSDIVIKPLYEKVDFGLSLRDNGYYITAYYGENEEIIIPEYFHNIPVVGIASEAFKENNRIKNIIFPSNLIEIENKVFYNCASISKIDLPKNLEIIGDEAFADCWSLKTVFFPDSLCKIGTRAFSGCDLIQSVIIPSNLVEMGSGVFENCSRMARAEIYSPVVGVQAFLSCSSLSELIIHDTVQVISPHAFFLCSMLTDVYIPTSVISIGDNAFSWCVKLQYIYTDKDNLKNLQNIFSKLSHIYTNFQVVSCN
ncbi:MAG: leucine-rich repeat protein [Bacilli bacterium]|nr:leucine-rich repeat protein [Bacilli bacterium]